MSTDTADASQIQPATYSHAAPAKRVVIQGVRGAFHEIAARHCFGADIEPVPALSFPELFAKVADPKQSDCAVMAIENSIAGSILGNYKLLLNSTLRIVGEVSLPIRQNLMALPGVPLEDIREVHSHPMALAQCEVFFKKYPRIRLVESEDTAESASRIARRHLRHTAAIASTLAAELYGLHILAPAIEDNPNNFTRFLAVTRGGDSSPALPGAGEVKCSVSFCTAHAPGALARVLTFLAETGTNLTKIQSVPLVGRVWEYQFFVDFTFDQPQEVVTVLTELESQVVDFKLFGIYTPEMEG